MANKNLFQSYLGKLLPVARATNHEFAPAYEYGPKHKLAQYAVTGCLNATYYAGAQTQLQTVLDLAQQVEPAFIAQCAIYARERGYMKDMPALLTALLCMRGSELLPQVFPRAIDNGKMLRNFVQIVRSGVVGRKSLGTRPKKLVQMWLNAASETALLRASVGNDPSLADVVKMVHPKPTEAWREAYFAWLIGKPVDIAALPPITQQFERYKRDRSLELPDVPFQMLTALELDRFDWALIARQANWQMLRMNLNTFARHGAFDVPGVAQAVAEKLADAKAIAKARAFPYQLMAAYCAAASNIPAVVSSAMQDAMDIAIMNIPQYASKVVVCPDVSGSMASPVTGYRAGATSAVRCIDVAALVAAAMLRQNTGARVLPFETDVVPVQLNARDSVMTNAQKLAAIGGGGTNCSAPLAQLNREKAQADLVVYVSDNQSWVDAQAGATGTMREWAKFKRRNPQAKLVCIDLQPYGTTQAVERADVLNVGGFSDEVFNIIGAFAADSLHPEHWVGAVDQVALAPV